MRELDDVDGVEKDDCELDEDEELS